MSYDSPSVTAVSGAGCLQNLNSVVSCSPAGGGTLVINGTNFYTNPGIVTVTVGNVQLVFDRYRMLVIGPHSSASPPRWVVLSLLFSSHRRPALRLSSDHNPALTADVPAASR